MSLTKVTYSMIQGESLNVLDYGAVGDGVTDDTAALNAAVIAADAAKKSLYVPAGVYKTTAVWSIPIKVFVYGESMAVQDGYDPANAWQYGSIIYKAHTGNAIEKIGTGPYDEGAPIQDITISSHRTNFPGGNGFVIDKCSTVHLIRCNVFAVGGDCYQLGVTAGDVTGHNYVFNCYSNNPTGVHYRIRQKWGRYLYPVTDGGTIGMFFDAAPESQVEGFHFEGFTQIGIKISNGSTNCVFSGKGYIGHTTANPVIGVQITNEPGNSGCVFENISMNADNTTGDEGMQLFPNAVGVSITNCKFVNWDTAIATSAGYSNGHTTIQNCLFYNCNLPIYAAGDYTYILNNVFQNTIGPYTINHISGTNGLWSGNSFDKAPNPAVTGVQGNYSGIRVKDNTGFVTRNSGVTSGTIVSGGTIAHGLAASPAGYQLTPTVAGITSQAYVSSVNATTMTVTWSGTTNVQFSWSANLPCDY